MRGVSKRYGLSPVRAAGGARRQLRDRAGTLTTLLGPRSGCGKTTTLRHDRRARGASVRQHLDRRPAT
jgi:ABC-type Fe3+/spermidine/putrescine transport system ATPase subunit